MTATDPAAWTSVMDRSAEALIWAGTHVAGTEIWITCPDERTLTRCARLVRARDDAVRNRPLAAPGIRLVSVLVRSAPRGGGVLWARILWLDEGYYQQRSGVMLTLRRRLFEPPERAPSDLRIMHWRPEPEPGRRAAR